MAHRLHSVSPVVGVSMRHALLCFFVVSLSSCGRKTSFTPGAQGLEGRWGIQYDGSVPEDQHKLIEADLATLSSLNLPTPSDNETRIVGNTDFSGRGLMNWLTARVAYIVGESYQWETLKHKEREIEISPRTYEQASLFATAPTIKTVMENTTGYVYLTGREDGAIYSLPLNGNYVLIKTPRRGAIGIGEGLFTTYRIKSSTPDRLANQLLRLAVFFHEARHSDGNGSNACFPHELCPSGTYQGKHACERNLNGPYAVEAVILQAFYRACRGCTRAELDGFNRYIADAESRLLSDAVMSDASPEKME